MMGSCNSGAGHSGSMSGTSEVQSLLGSMVAQGKEGSEQEASPAPIRSKYRGLSWDKKHQGWSVRIYFAGKQRHVGRFEEDVVAARAYDKAAVYLYGANAVTNFGLEACQADPTEVGAFIVVAKGQAEQEQLARSQRQQQAHGVRFGASGVVPGGPAQHGFSIMLQQQQQQHLLQQHQQQQLLSASQLDSSQAGALGLTMVAVPAPAQHHSFPGSWGGVPGMQMPTLMQQQPGPPQQQQLWMSSGGMAPLHTMGVASQPLQQAHHDSTCLMALGPQQQQQQQPFMLLSQPQDGHTGTACPDGYVLCGSDGALALTQGQLLAPQQAHQLVMLSGSLPPASQAQQHIGGVSCVSAATLGGAAAACLSGSGGGMLPPASMGLGSLSSLAPGAPMVCAASGALAGGSSGSAGRNSHSITGTTSLMHHMPHNTHGQQQQQQHQHSLGTSVWCLGASSGGASLSLGATACLANRHVSSMSMACASTAVDGSPTYSTGSTGSASGPPAFGFCHLLPGAGSTACV